MNMRALLVEDDEICAKKVVNLLRENRISCHVERHGEDGYLKLSHQSYDVLIIDLGLGHMHGSELIQKIRKSTNIQNNHQVPIIVLSAYQNYKDKIQSLLCGADDYITKPYHNEELILRILGAIRRCKGHITNKITVGPLELDLHNRYICINSNKLELTTKEYDLLEYLILNKNSLILKNAIMNHLYRESVKIPTKKIVDVLVCKVRQKLEQHNAEQYLKTEWGRGYSIVDDAMSNVIVTKLF